METNHYNENGKMTTKVLVFCAICIAIAMVLSMVKVYKMPQGGSVSACSMFFVTIIGYWYGPKTGVLAGVCYGLLQLVLDPHIIHPVQFLVDYIFAFGALGLSGFFRKGKYSLLIGYTVAVFGRFVFSVISGVVFFSEYAGDQNALIYSIIYNASYIVPEAVATLSVMCVPAFRNVIDTVGRTNVLTT